MSGPASEGDYELTVEEIEQEAGLVEPNEAETVVEEQPDEEPAADTEPDAEETAAGDAAEPAEPEEPQKRSWREIINDPDIDWDGYVEAKLEELPPAAAKQRQYLSRLASEYQQKMAEMGQQKPAEPEPAQPAKEDPEPPMPSFDDDQQTFMAKQQAREQWIARQAVNAAKQEMAPFIERVQKSEQEREQLRREQHLAKVESRLAFIQSVPGWSPEVQEQMDVMAEAYPDMYQMAFTDDGARYLVNLAKMQVDERTAKTRTVERKAAAPERVINRPTPQAAAKNAEDTIPDGSPEEMAMSLAERPEFADLWK